MSTRNRVSLYCPLVLMASLLATGQVAVTTHHNDNSRTGQNLNETVLNTSNVNVNGFGKLFSRIVDGQIYAQPLYVPNLNIGGQTRNVVYVATANNSVYAFDADDPTASAPLWQINLGSPVQSKAGVPVCRRINSTPVIDTSTNTMYVVPKSEDASGNYYFYIHALDIIAGMEKFGGPVQITGQVPGSGLGSIGGYVSFIAADENQRPGLLLQNGTVYMGFGSVCEISPWHGWLFGYNAATLQQVAIYNTTPNGSFGGIWGGGQGLVGDSNNNIYFMTGNGTFDANTAGGDYGDSFVKLSTATGVSVLDYFTPDTQAYLSSVDMDLGSGGPMALPGTSLIVGTGKDGEFRVVDTNNMGQYNSTFDNDVQEFKGTAGVFMGGPAYWNSPNFGPLVYIWSGGDYLKAYQFVNGKFKTSPGSRSAMQEAVGYNNSVALSVSANGNQTGSGIVWTSAGISRITQAAVPGILRAFDATNLSNELWDSQQNVARDGVGYFARFVPPTVANGKVYLATFSNQLVVYGLNPPPTAGIQFVQVNAATPNPSAAAVGVAYQNPQGAGDLNIVVVGWNDTTSTITSVKDGMGNTYSLAVGPIVGNRLSQSIYYATNILAGTNKVSVTFNQSAASPDVRILEYSGLDTTAPLDVTASATGNGSTASSGSATTNAANELIFGADTVFTGNSGAGSGFTARIITSPDSDLAEDEIVGVTGSYAATAPLTSSGNWVMQMVTFKAIGSPSKASAHTMSHHSPKPGSVSGRNAVPVPVQMLR